MATPTTGVPMIAEATPLSTALAPRVQQVQQHARLIVVRVRPAAVVATHRIRPIALEVRTIGYARIGGRAVMRRGAIRRRRTVIDRRGWRQVTLRHLRGTCLAVAHVARIARAVAA